jgi:hypothetical protein
MSARGREFRLRGEDTEVSVPTCPISQWSVAADLRNSAIAPASAASCIPQARHQTNNVLSLCAIAFIIVRGRESRPRGKDTEVSIPTCPISRQSVAADPCTLQ